MKVVGIAAEFNPFHNGHEYIIKQAKAMTGADYCIIVMSGDFVQSGKPAFCSKELRTRMALFCGADLVLMLPVSVSTASAEIFAEGAVALLDNLGCVDSLCFGSELCDLALLEQIADILLREPAAYKTALRAKLSEGLSFPAAREAAVLNDLAMQPLPLSLDPEHEARFISPEDIHTALASPNSILAIEYLKALKKLRSDITPVAIPRKNIAHLDGNIRTDAVFCSATALRQCIASGNDKDQLLTAVQPYVPEEIFPLYTEELFRTFPVSEEGLVSWLSHRLMGLSAKELLTVSDCDEALANSISSALFKLEDEPLSYENLLRLLTTKNYTRNRISRVLLHVLLNIQKTDMQAAKPYHYCLYARLLGFRSESAPLLHELKSSSKIPMISKLADRHTLSKCPQTASETETTANHMLALDILAGNQYSLLQKELYHVQILHETQKKIIKSPEAFEPMPFP